MVQSDRLTSLARALSQDGPPAFSDFAPKAPSQARQLLPSIMNLVAASPEEHSRVRRPLIPGITFPMGIESLPFPVLSGGCEPMALALESGPRPAGDASASDGDWRPFK
jgi:hypothetical protein